MKITSIDKLKSFFEDEKPLKEMGQNFLVDEEAIEKVVSFAEIAPEDSVLEIGPGPGALTLELAKKAKKVVAVEKDRKLTQILKKETEKYENVEIINSDAFLFSPDKHFDSDYKIVSNLPFYCSTAFIRKFLEEKKIPLMMLFIIQKEVASRITSKEKSNFLSVIIGAKADSEVVSDIPRSSFWPAPRVDASIIKITPHSRYSLNEDRFFSLVEAGFKHPRKQLKNNLSGFNSRSKKEIVEILKKAGLNPKIRPEKVFLEDWVRLLDLI